MQEQHRKDTQTKSDLGLTESEMQKLKSIR